jgi:hypothetical protein
MRRAAIRGENVLERAAQDGEWYEEVKTLFAALGISAGRKDAQRVTKMARLCQLVIELQMPLTRVAPFLVGPGARAVTRC